MHWVQAGFILYAFSSPSSITGVAYTFAHAGLAAGAICCVVCTAASVAGALLLLRLVLACPCRPLMLSDVAKQALGPRGAALGLALQMGNFVLYLPVALLTTAQALQDAVQPSEASCTKCAALLRALLAHFGVLAVTSACVHHGSYFIFFIALLCFGTTQLRQLRHTSLLAAGALLASLAVAALQLTVVASTSSSTPPREPARWFGPPGGSGGSGRVEMALALTTCVWSFVPALFVAELAAEMPRPHELRKAILLSGALNLLIFLGTGLPVARGAAEPAARFPRALLARLPCAPPPHAHPPHSALFALHLPYLVAWGGAVEDPVTRSASWPSFAPAARALSALLAAANAVVYCLDSVPLARWCQRRFAPDFDDRWTARAVGRYARINAPFWFWAVAASVFVGQPSGLFTMLAWATALTVADPIPSPSPPPSPALHPDPNPEP